MEEGRKASTSISFALGLAVHHHAIVVIIVKQRSTTRNALRVVS